MMIRVNDVRANGPDMAVRLSPGSMERMVVETACGLSAGEEIDEFLSRSGPDAALASRRHTRFANVLTQWA